MTPGRSTPGRLTAAEPTSRGAASSVENAAEIWREHDAARALHAVDLAAIRETAAARALVLDLLAARGEPRDLYNACARLGGLLADAGASPSLAASTMEGAACALQRAEIPFDEARLASARASIAEGYLAAVRDAERIAARRSWEYPACAVRIDRETVAIAAGLPADDREALADWAARAATAASRDGVKRAVLSGSESARGELASALRLLGIEVDGGAEAPAGIATGRLRWLRLPWTK